jgi:ankyrin repeat protein
MDYLSKQQTTFDIKKALSHLPDSALRAFKASTKQIAQKIKANSGSGESLLTKHILLWVSHAKVDLNIEQIQDSFAVQKSEGQCYEDYRPVESLVWRACTELVRTDSEKGTLTLAHKSVKKHLQQCEIIPKNTDLEIGKTCLYFLVNACNEKGRSPLLQYAAKYWWAHLNSKGQVLDEKTDSLVMKFLRDGSNLTRAFKTMEMTGGSAFDGMTGLHAAVHFDLLSWAERLASSVDVDAQCSDGQTALHWAVRYGRHKFLELLVRISANPDMADQAGDTPLHKALVGPAIDNVAVVEALLKGHARLDVRNKEGVSPLERVIQYGPTSIAKMMIENQKDVNAEIFGDWTLLRQIFSHSQDICGVVDQGSFRTKNGGWNRLQVAVRDHTDFLTNLLLERGVDLNRPSTRDGWVPLVFAASKGDLSKMRLLLTRQPNPAKVGMRDRKGKTPLWWATHNKETGAIQLLAEHGADVNETYTDGLTPLHEAVKQKSSKAVQLLVSLGANVNTRTANKPMLLIEAIRLRDRDTAWVLLNVGMQPDEQDANGKSALSYAIESRDYALVWLLISKGATVTASSLAKKSGCKSTCVQSPLELALRLDDHRTAWLLCEHGASPNTAVDDTGRTLLHLAIDRGNLRAVRLLVYHGAGIGAQGEGGLTPLHYAVLLEREDIVTLLVSQAPESSSLDVTDAKGNTALTLAVQKKCLAITQILIRHGASCNAADPDGLTPVHHAARLGFSEGLRMLLDGGGNPNMVDKELFTPVHHAINGGYADSSLVNMLVAAGANLEARDANRRTPLMLAAQLGKDELAAWFLDAGAGAQLRV